MAPDQPVAEARQNRLERIVGLARDDQPGLAALQLAGFEYPDLESERYLAWFDRAAEQVSGADHLALRRVIGISEGLGGNVEDYYHPDNSFLNRVIETRRGIPITLSVIWMEVGRRAGIDVVGVGLPGHFLVTVGGELVDPFHYGEAIGIEEAAALVRTALGREPVVEELHLTPVDTTMILTRMALNLQRVYARRQDGHGFAWTTALIRSLMPDG